MSSGTINFFLYEAAREADIDRLMALLLDDINIRVPSFKSSQQKTPLLAAACNGHFEVVKILVEYDRECLSDSTIQGLNALHLACNASGSPELVRYLVEQGIDVNSVSKDSYRPIHYATLFDRFDLVQLLKELGADIHALTDLNKNIVSISAETRGIEILEWALDQGVNPNVLDTDGLAPIHRVARNGFLDSAAVLLRSKNVDVNAVNHPGYTAIEEADRRNMSALAFYLWDHGYDTFSLKNLPGFGPVSWHRPRILNIPPQRYHAASVAVGSKVYLLGGQGYSDNYVNHDIENMGGGERMELCDFYEIDLEKVEFTSMIPPGCVIEKPNITLNPNRCGSSLIIHEDLLTVSTRADVRHSIPNAVIATKPFFRQYDKAGYFEIEIISMGVERTVTMGLVDSRFPVEEENPGWIADSYGYHGDDGMCFHNHGSGKPWGECFNPGDVIGCGINFSSEEVWFCRNGKFLGVAYLYPQKSCYWAVAATSGSNASFRFNFGASPFKFNFIVPTLEWKKLKFDNSQNLRNPCPNLFRLPSSRELVMVRHSEYGLSTDRIVAIDPEQCATRFITYTGPLRILNYSQIFQHKHYICVFSGLTAPHHDETVFLTRCELYLLDMHSWHSYDLFNQDFPPGESPSPDASEVDELTERGGLETETEQNLEAKKRRRDFVLMTIGKEMPYSSLASVGDYVCFLNYHRGRWRLFKVNFHTWEYELTYLRGNCSFFRQPSINVVGKNIICLGGWDRYKQLSEIIVVDTEANLIYKPHMVGQNFYRSRNEHCTTYVETRSNKFALDCVNYQQVLGGSVLRHYKSPPSLSDSSDLDSQSSRSIFFDLEHYELLPFADEVERPESRPPYRWLVSTTGWNGLNMLFDFDVAALDNQDPNAISFELVSLLSDVQLEVVDPEEPSSSETIHAHRIILWCRSSYFREYFSSQLNQARSHEPCNSVIRICENCLHFHSLISYLYTDQIDILPLFSTYRRFISLVSRYAPEHVTRLVSKYLLSRESQPSIMSFQLLTAFDNDLFADIYFLVEGRRIPAHKFILCLRSSFFSALCTGGMKESYQTTITLPNVSLPSFLFILQYIYTGQTNYESFADHIIDAFVLAFQYDIRPLKEQLESDFVQSIRLQNVVNLLILADQQSAFVLRQGCIRYIFYHLDDFLHLPEYSESKEAILHILKRHGHETFNKLVQSGL
ncbi:uncharacterized protein LOC126325820 [Schistocerca gregaria]|uniref:uncharacterized protein LOC126325820 n=1 Tax=Schistocerca gregaria TaxID=7010 RepID=UPI00211E9151|nr:uncharacterized protein LOC126325820 [Schistocerca gregaria]XP_049851259.1 uncharacterized protein LOC126325820 [Schistocerca gregaria]